MFKKVDKLFLKDNPMFSEMDTLTPHAVQKIKELENKEFIETDEYELLIANSSLVFTNKNTNKRTTVNYPPILEGANYREYRFEDVVKKYTSCLEIVQDFGFDII